MQSLSHTLKKKKSPIALLVPSSPYGPGPRLRPGSPLWTRARALAPLFPYCPPIPPWCVGAISLLLVPGQYGCERVYMGVSLHCLRVLEKVCRLAPSCLHVK